MPPRKELCRNFQRGSCQYGDRCKFVHATSQQSKGNPFGFGVQTSNSFQWSNNQQQTSNPFGFGVQNKSQSIGGSGAGSKPNQFKPFENKWTRSNSSNQSASRQPETPPQGSGHKCTDPETCKRMIIQDLEEEKPLWKLTCYAHNNKEGPCDIAGDISSEELRALAYDEAKDGKSLPFIIERERSLLASKFAEFQNLLQKPYAPSSIAASGAHNPFGFGSSNPSLNSSISPPASNFSQLNASLNTSSATASSYTFGQSNAFQNNITRSQPNGLQMNSSPSNHPGVSGSQPPQHPVQNPFSFGSARSNNSAASAHNNPFSNLANSSRSGNIFDRATMGTNSAPTLVGHSSISTPLVSNMLKEIANVDDEIWTKPEWKWNAGEIPEHPPPDMYIR